MEKLSSTLKHLLNTANISEAELARRTGIAQPMVNRLATGKNKNPKLETLKPIAKYFSVTFSQLLGEEDLPLSDNNEKLTTINTSTSYQVPVIEWNNYLNNNTGTENLVASTVKVSDKAFALLLQDNNLEPRFSANTLLTIEPEADYQANDFVLAKNNLNAKISLMQIVVDGDSKQLKSLSTEDNTDSQGVDNYSVIGVLVQSRHDYK